MRLGNPLDFILTPGQAHDLEGADALLPDMEADTLLADKAFDADERVIEPLLAAGKDVRHPAQEQPQGSTRLSTKTPTRHATSSRISSASSSNTAPSPPATTKPPEISSPQSTSPPLSSGNHRSFLQANSSANSLACRAMQPAAFMGGIGTKKKNAAPTVTGTRGSAMEHRQFGGTGMKVSAIGFGCWEIGGGYGDRRGGVRARGASGARPRHQLLRHRRGLRHGHVRAGAGARAGRAAERCAIVTKFGIGYRTSRTSATAAARGSWRRSTRA